jgi:hypothetical protein
MPFPKIDNNMLNLGGLANNIPVIGAGDKLPISLLDTGSAANKVVQLDSSAKLPALNGSQLTNLPATGAVWNLLSAQEAVGVAQVDFTSLITNTYKNYALVVDNIRKDTDSSVNFRMSSNNGTAFDAGSTDYRSATIGINSNGNELASNSGSGTASIQISAINLSGDGDHAMSLVMFLYDPLDANVTSHFAWQVFASNGLLNLYNGAGKRDQVGAHNAIRIFAASGLFTQGTFKLYGIL